MNTVTETLFRDYIEKHKDSEEFKVINTIVEYFDSQNSSKLGEILNEAVYKEIRSAFKYGMNCGMDIVDVVDGGAE